MPFRPTQLQIFGERCSGTNYVAQLLRRNLLGLRLTDEFGWKHGWPDRVTGAAEHCVFVVVHRDPFAWAESLHRQPWHAAPPLRELPFAQFLRTPWWCCWGQDMALAPNDPRIGSEMQHERDPVTGERFDNVLSLRTAKLRAWLALAGRVRHFAVVRYEDAVQEPRRLVQELAQRCGLRRWPWLRPVRTWKGGKDPFVARAVSPFAPADVDWIRSSLDLALERACGHDVVARAAALLGEAAAVTPASERARAHTG